MNRDPKHLQNLATELHALAAVMTDVEYKARMIRTAQTYEVLSEWQKDFEAAVAATGLTSRRAVTTR